MNYESAIATKRGESFTTSRRMRSLFSTSSARRPRLHRSRLWQSAKNAWLPTCERFRIRSTHEAYQEATFGTCRLGGWRQRPVPATQRGRESLYRIEAGARRWSPRTSRTKGVDAGRVGASDGIESVARRQDGSSRPLGVARLDHAVAPHHRSYRNRHCQVDQTCRNRASCLETRRPILDSNHIFKQLRRELELKCFDFNATICGSADVAKFEVPLRRALSNGGSSSHPVEVASGFAFNNAKISQIRCHPDPESRVRAPSIIS